MKKLIDYLQYIRKNHLKDVATETLRASKAMDIPILKLFAHIPDEVMLAQSMKGINDFVDSLLDGTHEEKQIANLKLWEEDKLPGIPKDSIEPTDLIMIYLIQKEGYFKFIPLYTKDVQLAIDIVMEMEQLHLSSQLAGINLMFRLRKKVENELELSNKELEAFSYSVSHDLRAPLRAIHGYTKILTEDYQDKMDDEGRLMMNSIISNSDRMGQLIDDLLAFSRLGKKEMQITEVNMTQLAQDALAEVKNAAEAFHCKVIIHPLLPARADRSLIYQVLTNLISNAVKYSDKKASPVVEISSTEKDGEHIYSIKDNGEGFNMNYYDKLFGVFQRLHSNTEFEGTGIGLALVKRIMVRHGGKIWAEAELGRGATFYFSLKN